MDNDSFLNLGSSGKIVLTGLMGYTVRKKYQKEFMNFKFLTTLHYRSGTSICVDQGLSSDSIDKLDKAIEITLNSNPEDEINSLKQKVDLLSEELSNLKYQFDAFIQMAGNSTDLGGIVSKT